MFPAIKRVTTSKGNTYEYIQIVHNYRRGKKIKQRVILNLGRKESINSAQIDQLIKVLERFASEVMVLNTLEPEMHCKWSRDFGLPLLYQKLWEQVGLKKIITDIAASRKAQFNLEGAVFLLVLNRLLNPGSELSCSKWKDQAIYLSTKTATRRQGDFAKLQLQHLYRALDFIEDKKETIETRLIVGILLDSSGLPIGCEFRPGNSVDSTAISELIGKVKQRFNLENIIWVSDTGRTSENNIKSLHKESCGFILGCRLRNVKEVCQKFIDQKKRKKVLAGLRVIKRSKAVKGRANLKYYEFQSERYLSLYLSLSLNKLLVEAGRRTEEINDALADVKQIKMMKIRIKDKIYYLRTELSKTANQIFKTLKISAGKRLELIK